VLAVPAIMLLIAYAGWVTVQTAVIVALVALIGSLAVIAQIAVSRTGFGFWKRTIVLAAIVILGVGVVALEQLAH
jgi:purine-cytosine permease-like protein